MASNSYYARTKNEETTTKRNKRKCISIFIEIRANEERQKDIWKITKAVKTAIFKI